MKTSKEQKEQDFSGDIHRITLRIPVELHERISRAAKAGATTVTAEILSRLEASTLRDEFAAQAREIADLKRMMRELLDK
jgi:hypothetical protein